MTFHGRRAPAPRAGPTCIDLFAGAGGLAAGFRLAGWQVVSGNDVSPHAGATFRRNFPEASFFEGPIGALNPAIVRKDAGLRRGQLDCLIGGPPCQSFSFNNHQRSATDVRARLFRDYLEIVSDLRPRTLVMENVPGIVSIGGGRVLRAITRALATLGYASEVRILYAEDFGVPQRRRRVFILGTRLGWEEELFPDGTYGPSEKPGKEANPYAHHWAPSGRRAATALTTVWDAIGDIPRISIGFAPLDEGLPYLVAAKTAYQRRMRGRLRTVRNHYAHDITERMLERIAHVPEGGNWRDIPRRLLPAGMKRAKLSCHTTRYGRLHRRKLCCTILTKCDPHWGSYIHPTQDRTISVREAARLQSFPDRFVFTGPVSHQYVQVGNAVPPLVAGAVGRAVKGHIARRG